MMILREYFFLLVRDFHTLESLLNWAIWACREPNRNPSSWPATWVGFHFDLHLHLFFPVALLRVQRFFLHKCCLIKLFHCLFDVTWPFADSYVHLKWRKLSKVLNAMPGDRFDVHYGNLFFSVPVLEWNLSVRINSIVAEYLFLFVRWTIKHARQSSSWRAHKGYTLNLAMIKAMINDYCFRP